MGALDFLNVVLVFPPLVSILIISVVVSVVTTVVYKFTTNQKLMKEIKDDIRRMQAEAKASKEPGRAAQIQKDMMKRSMEQFSASTKSMIITLVPLFLLFGWMGSHLAYEPISVNEEFTTTMKFAPGVTGNATIGVSDSLQLLSSQSQEISNGAIAWRLKAVEEGTHKISYSFGSEVYTMSALVTGKYMYDNPVIAKKKGLKDGSSIERISVDLRGVKPFGSLSILGWEPGWLATYIILSLVASLVLRKILKVH